VALKPALWLGVGAAALLLVLGDARANEPAAIPLPVPKVTIYPGDMIAADALHERMFVARSVARATVVESHEALVGKVARRTLLLNQPIAVNAIRDPFVIAQGKQAFLVFKTDGLTITSGAIALQNGGVGDIVSARNADSGIVVRGIVQSDGSIRVDDR
jgi:flagellar basal body P-ring formation protein FlgA